MEQDITEKSRASRMKVSLADRQKSSGWSGQRWQYGSEFEGTIGLLANNKNIG